MANSSAGSAAFLAGEEIVNDARTLAYLDAGYGPNGLMVSGGCACPRIRELIECGGDPYVSPKDDPAPWYDASIPESADFAGFLMTEFDGLGSTYTRTAVDKLTGGAVLGRLQAKGRVLSWKGFLFGRSECSVRYGLAWLTANLKGQSCVCGGEDLDLLICCPELTESAPVSGCNSVEISKPAVCPPFTEPDAFRTLKNVGLIEGPKILSQRKTGCTSNCGSSACLGGDGSLIMEVEFHLLAGNPYFYGCPVCLCVDQTFEEVLDCTTDPFWIKYDDIQIAAQQAANTAAGLGNPLLVCRDECPDAFDCSADVVSVCPPVSLPFIPEFVDGCFCDPLLPVQNCCEIQAESFGTFFEGAPIIEIYSGSSVMRSTTIRFFDNPQGLSCCETATDPCRNCDSLKIRFIPKDSTLTIDGTTRTVTLQCPGVTSPISADHLTVTPFTWPLLECLDFCICTETDAAAVAANATVSISIVPREMS